MSNSLDITVIGAAVMDILASAAGPKVFDIGSMPMDYIKTSYGGYCEFCQHIYVTGSQDCKS